MNWKSIVGIGALLAVVAASVAFFYPFRERRDRLWLPGVVEIQEIRLGSKVGGRVAEVKAVEGELVELDQELVRFDIPELQAQFEQQLARVGAAEAELAKALNGPRPEEIRQAKSDWESAEADLKYAQQDFERIDRLYRQNSASRDQYDVALAVRNRTEGRSRSALARLDLLKAGTRSEEKDEARARLAEQRGRLQELEANVREAIVRAPCRAVVEVVSVRKGDLVQPNQPIVRILRAEDLWVKVYVPETELGKVLIGQRALVSIDAFPGRMFEGTVYMISSESEFTPRNIQSIDERRHQVFGVRIRVQQPEDPKQQIFKSGMAAEVQLMLSPPPTPGEAGISSQKSEVSNQD